jgi:glucose/mannose-6-phosphate isomerase
MKPENQKMIGIIEQFPLMITSPIVDCRLEKGKSFKKIVFCGMGGSSIVPFVIKDIFGDQIKIPFEITQDYRLPPATNDESLVIICSYSGNTEETLSCFREASRKRCNIVSIASGGTLLRESQLSKHEWIKIKEGIPPRTAFPNMFAATLEILETKGIIKPQKRALSSFVNCTNIEEIKTMAQRVANALKDRIPVIYSSDYHGVLMRIKNEFNENTKIPAKFELYPELCHNDIVGWGNKNLARHFKVIQLRNRDESERMTQRINMTRSLLNDVVEQIEIHMLKSNRLENALTTILLFDLVSVYLADIYGTDAYSVEIIEKLKHELGKTKQ